MKLETIGTLIKDDKYDDMFETENPVKVKFLKCEIPFILDKISETTDMSKYEEALKNFLKLTAKDRTHLCKYLLEYFEDQNSWVDDPLELDIEKTTDIFQYVNFTSGSIELVDNEIYISIEGECEWDEEHGVQIVYKNGTELVKVSAYDGHVTNCRSYNNPEFTKIYITHDDILDYWDNEDKLKKGN